MSDNEFSHFLDDVRNVEQAKVIAEAKKKEEIEKVYEKIKAEFPLISKLAKDFSTILKQILPTVSDSRIKVTIVLIRTSHYDSKFTIEINENGEFNFPQEVTIRNCAERVVYLKTMDSVLSEFSKESIKSNFEAALTTTLKSQNKL